MKCLWLNRGRLELRSDVPAPVPAKGEVVVRVLRAGICSTDAALIDGMYGFSGIPGHEFVGVAISGPSGIRDRRVVGDINITCGMCHACKRGDRKHCSQRKALGIRSHHGAFAELLVLPMENLHQVPDGVSNEAAVFVEPLAAALDVLDQVQIQAGQRALVVGDGKLGQLVCRVLSLSGAITDVVGRYPNKLERLDGIVKNLFRDEAFDPRSYDVAVECTGNPTGLSIALNALKPRGALVIKSTFSGNVQIDVSRIVVDELRLLGSRCGPFKKALALLDQGRVDPLPLIDTCFTLEDGVEALRHSRKPGVLKVLFDLD